MNIQSNSICWNQPEYSSQVDSYANCGAAEPGSPSQQLKKKKLTLDTTNNLDDSPEN